ncbi:MAG: hypothetical protein JRH20_03745 [Deltaproteobacteria bacterium]|nr:hypothetical protein [Deltaproteobacteria bacterium]
MSDKDLFLPPDVEENPLELETADIIDHPAQVPDLELNTSGDGPPLPAGALAGAASKRAGTSLPLTRGVALLLLLLLALVGWEVAALVLQQRNAPGEAHFKAAVAKLTKEKGKARDAVLVAPAWAEPTMRQYLGTHVDLKLATLSDVDGFARVWELSMRGARHPWLEKIAAPTKSWRFGPLTLARYDKNPAKLNFDFHEKLSSAHVSVEPGTPKCRRVGKRFVCSPQRWNWVGSYLAEVGHRPYRCIYAHPVRGHKLRIDFARVALGGNIVGYTGIDDFENRKKAKGPVTLTVFVGDEQVGQVLHQNQWPWQRFTIDTHRFVGRFQRVRFEISAEKTAYRHFCFHAEARR